MILGGVVCIGAMLLNEFADGENWMLEMAKWLSFGGKFAISGSFWNLFQKFLYSLTYKICLIPFETNKAFYTHLRLNYFQPKCAA